MASSADAAIQNDAISWIQIDDTVVPVVQRWYDDGGGRVDDMLPLQVIRYGMDLSDHASLAASFATTAECRHLSELCSKAGFEFHFGEITELVRLTDFMNQYGSQVSFHVLPDEDPFRYLCLKDEVGPTSLEAQQQQQQQQQQLLLQKPCPGFGSEFSDSDVQPIDLSIHRTNHWPTDQALEEAVSKINDPHNVLYYRMSHKASVRNIHGQKILCLVKNNSLYVTLQKLYTAFFSHLSIAIFTGTLGMIGVPLFDMPTGYGNITRSIPEKMVLLEDVSLAIHRMEVELNGMKNPSRSARLKIPTKPRLGSGLRGNATNEGSKHERPAISPIKPDVNDDRSNCVSALVDRGRSIEVTADDRGCRFRLGRGIEQRLGEAGKDETKYGIDHGQRYDDTVSGRKRLDNDDGVNAQNVAKCGRKGEQRPTGSGNESGRELNNSNINNGRRFGNNQERQLDDDKEDLDGNGNESRQHLDNSRQHLDNSRQHLDNSRKHIDHRRKQYKQHLGDRKQYLDNSRVPLHDRKQHLDGSREHLDRQNLDHCRQHLDDSRQHQDDSRQHLDDGKEHLDHSKEHLDYGRQHLDDSIEHLDDSIEHLDDSKEHPDDSKEHLDDNKEHLDYIKEHLDDSKEHPDDSKEQLDDSKEHLDYVKEHLDDSKEHLGDSKELLHDSRQHLEDSRHHLEDSRHHLDDNIHNLDDGRDHLDGSRDILDDSRHRLDGSRDILDDSRHRLDESRQRMGVTDENNGQRIDYINNNKDDHSVMITDVGRCSTYVKRKRLLETISQIRCKKLKYI